MSGPESDHLFVYSEGPVMASVCTDLPKDQVADEMNRTHPTGITAGWTISELPRFETGEPNGRVCDEHPTRRHYLMEC
jgi:hypothetical protein